MKWIYNGFSVATLQLEGAVNRHSYYVAILAICGVVWFEIDKPRNLYRYGKD